MNPFTSSWTRACNYECMHVIYIHIPSSHVHTHPHIHTYLCRYICISIYIFIDYISLYSTFIFVLKDVTVDDRFPRENVLPNGRKEKKKAGKK
jgi:hypothetical protein